MARLIDAVQGHSELWQNLLKQKQHGHLAHALAFTGSPGIGKCKVAFALAQALVCERTDEACGECGPCRRIEAGQSESLLFIEPQSGTIKLEAAAQVLEFLALQKLGRARVVIVEQAQMLNAQTANALLKSIEEPPPETFFILLSSEISQLLPTLRSRLQNVRFSPLSEALLAASVTGAPPWMLRSARGSFELLEQFQDPKMSELRSLAMDFLRDASQDQRTALDQVLGEAKERESALGFVRLMQQILRDWVVLDSNPIIHSDLSEQLKALPSIELRRRVDLWRAAHQVEVDFLAHIDRGLTLENFYYRTRQALR